MSVSGAGKMAELENWQEMVERAERMMATLETGAPLLKGIMEESREKCRECFFGNQIC